MSESRIIKPAHGPKYDARVNPVYQVDWSNEAAGKRVAATKRKVRFRFGFSSREALEQGLTGMDCRGEEHDVCLVWSLTSGKRRVTFDGREIHATKGAPMEGRFDTSWVMQGGHIVKLVANASAPMAHTPGFRQFDLTLDGLSFFAMPKIFELGVKKLVGVPRSPTPGYNNTSMRSAHDNHRASPEESYNRGPQRRTTPMLTAPHDEEEAKPVTPAAKVPDVPAQDLLTDFSSNAANDILDVMSPSPQSLAIAQDEFAPVEPPKPTFTDVSNQILATYGPSSSVPPTTLALTNEPHNFYAQENGYYPPQTQGHYLQPPHHPGHYGYQQPGYYQTPTPVTPESIYSPSAEEEAFKLQQEQQLAQRPPVIMTPTMAPLTLEELDAREQQPDLSPMERAVRALVNLDDIIEVKETPAQLQARRDRDAKQKPTSKPKPRAKPAWNVGMNATLKDIQETATKTTPTTEVMRTHAFDPAAAQAGMMVPYGQSGIPTAQGFGAGVHQSFAGREMQMYGQQMAYRAQMPLPQQPAFQQRSY